jgi:L-ascorbate oxidase
MTVVEADSHYVEPFVVDNLDIYSGQSYSVLITANQEPTRNYWVGLNVRGRKPATPTGLAVLQYLPSNSSSGLLLPPTPAPQSPLWNDFAVTVAQAEKYAAKTGLVYSAPPAKSDRVLIFLITQNTIDGHIKWAINNISYVPTATPVLAAFKFKLWKAFDQTPPPDRPPPSDNHLDIFATPNPNSTHARYGNGVYVFKLGKVVDVVIQNTNTLNPNNSEIHPWHLHGHDFWVLGYGEGVFDPQTDPAQSYNLVNPPLRNTVAVFPYGWVAIRFIANNPGAWPFHCHLEPHFFMGMGTVFAEGIHKLPHIPSETLGCGLTKPNW